MIENVFNTEDQALIGSEYDYQFKKEADKLIMPLEEWEKHYDVTTRWATPRLRKDGKYTYPVCPVSDGVYTTEEYNVDNYEVEGEA